MLTLSTVSQPLLLVTWKSHCIATGAVGWTLTGRLEVAVAAVLTATLPDQIEALLPFGKHRGASHWLTAWLGVVVSVPCYFHRGWSTASIPFCLHAGYGGHPLGSLIGAFAYGLALGPFLHVLMDGCSDSGVPLAPFSRQKMKLGLYRTYSHRWRWDLSELLFLGGLLACCAPFCRIRI